MKAKDNPNEVLREKKNINKRRSDMSRSQKSLIRKRMKRRRQRKIIIFLMFFSIIVSIIYYKNKPNDSILLNKQILGYIFKGKDEFLIELNNIKDSLSKLYITEEDENIKVELDKLEEYVKSGSKKEAQELIDKLELQINDIIAKNKKNLKEEYNKINDKINDNYNEEEDKIIKEYKEAYNNNNFLLAKNKLSELETYINSKKEISNNGEPVYINGILIANKEYGLPESFDPGESYEARQAFEEMKYQANLEGIYLNAFSTYRSYLEQVELYNKYVYTNGQEKADTFSSKPGFSEHQTGLAFDIGGRDQRLWAEDGFRYTEESKWLAENAYKYGFILRYPEGKESITGYQYESWHYRYVGIKHSSKFNNNNLTLEEYLGLVKS